MPTLRPHAAHTVCALAAALAAVPATTRAQAAALAPQQLERVEITGSAIRRMQNEGPAPVEIFTKKDIERTGATTISELVKNLSTIDINDQGELTGNSPSGSGSATLQIRGLSERNLLVLLNGRRLPVAALQDGSGAGAAVDVNNIPLSAIERIELLKDGGSAIYGADAVAGVINFITKKNYTGIEARVNYGMSSRRDAKEKGAGLLFGFGDYEAAGYNVLAALDLFKRDPLPRSARDLTRSADWRRFDNGQGFDGRSTFSPVGNIVAGPGAGTTVRPCPPEDLKGTLCRFDFSKTFVDSINGADRTSGLIIGSLKLAGMRAFTEVTLSESKSHFEAQPAPFTFADTVSGNTFRYRAMQFGPRTTDRKSSLVNIVAGLEGTTADIDWDVALGSGANRSTNNDSNFAATDRTFAALAEGSLDPTVTTNPDALIEALKIRPTRSGRSNLKFLNAKASGRAFELPGGPLGWAVGVSANRETLSDQPSADSVAGNVLGSIAQGPVDASRNSHAVFVELAIPILKDVEAQAAIRYDRYSGLKARLGGNEQSFTGYGHTSPKFAVKYQPYAGLLLRGSFAESFLAPSLKQSFGGVDEGASSTSDPAICAAFPALSGACDNFPFNQVSGSNPNLKPETGKTYNLGVVFEPHPVVSLGLDYFQIRKKDEISTPTVERAVAAGAIGISEGEAQVFTNNLNIASTRVNGFDVDLRLRFPTTPLGRLSIGNTLTYYIHIQQRPDPASPAEEKADTFATPRWRNNVTAALENGPWAQTAVLRMVASTEDTDLPHGQFAGRERRIGAHNEVDYQLQYKGFQALTLTGGIRNLFDSAPPYSLTGSQNQFGSLGFPFIFSPRGRFFYTSVNYAFR